MDEHLHKADIRYDGFYISTSPGVRRSEASRSVLRFYGDDQTVLEILHPESNEEESELISLLASYARREIDSISRASYVLGPDGVINFAESSYRGMVDSLGLNLRLSCSSGDRSGTLNYVFKPVPGLL